MRAFGSRFSVLLRQRINLAAALLAIGGVSGSCELIGPDPQLLRVHNVGSLSLSALSVGFPESLTSFGDIPSDVTTAYVHVPGGVYRYAYYRFSYADHVVDQPVIDFVGETPMEGQRFTYNVRLVQTPNGPRIDLVSIVRDQ
jgi:hypothetical protein